MRFNILLLKYKLSSMTLVGAFTFRLAIQISVAALVHYVNGGSLVYGRNVNHNL